MGRNSLYLLVLASLLSGCSSMEKAVHGVSAAGASPAVATPAASSYQQLAASSDGQPVQLTLPDGFGSSGARVVRQYFSASGKECLVAEAAGATLPRVFCKDPSGEVNMFSPPDQIVSN